MNYTEALYSIDSDIIPEGSDSPEERLFLRNVILKDLLDSKIFLASIFIRIVTHISGAIGVHSLIFYMDENDEDTYILYYTKNERLPEFSLERIYSSGDTMLIEGSWDIVKNYILNLNNEINFELAKYKVVSAKNVVNKIRQLQ